MTHPNGDEHPTWRVELVDEFLRDVRRGRADVDDLIRRWVGQWHDSEARGAEGVYALRDDWDWYNDW